MSLQIVLPFVCLLFLYFLYLFQIDKRFQALVLIVVSPHLTGILPALEWQRRRRASSPKRFAGEPSVFSLYRRLFPLLC